MNGNLKIAILGGATGLVALALAGCVSPARTPNDHYYEAPPERADTAPAQSTTTTYSENGSAATTTTTTTTTTTYDNGAPYAGDAASGFGDDAYDDPHHYGRGINQHKY
ncbi:MAG: hypothetical protein P4L72_11225 [Parvibaculum sp.]|uniref:hypothetical protein n=1 Tax=Parvibaculum sp. TaxID=2024848 RepID=UPI00283BF0DE|nr:hypothetical protein [Parvibaculum sp.]MDR3499782.1 hypothetical protein [Parvibaculum sp.]